MFSQGPGTELVRRISALHRHDGHTAPETFDREIFMTGMVVAMEPETLDVELDAPTESRPGLSRGANAERSPVAPYSLGSRSGPPASCPVGVASEARRRGLFVRHVETEQPIALAFPEHHAAMRWAVEPAGADFRVLDLQADKLARVVFGRGTPSGRVVVRLRSEDPEWGSALLGHWAFQVRGWADGPDPSDLPVAQVDRVRLGWGDYGPARPTLEQGREQARRATAETVPGPDDRFVFTRRDAMDNEELSAVGQATARVFKLDPAESLDELMVGDMLTFRIELLDGRKPVQSWSWARAICPRPDSIRAVVFRPPGTEHVHRIAADDVIEVPATRWPTCFESPRAGRDVAKQPGSKNEVETVSVPSPLVGALLWPVQLGQFVRRSGEISPRRALKNSSSISVWTKCSPSNRFSQRPGLALVRPRTQTVLVRRESDPRDQSWTRVIHRGPREPGAGRPSRTRTVP